MTFYQQDEPNVSLMALEQYHRFVRWTPDLSLEEEQQLLQRVHCGRLERTKAAPDARVLQDARQARDRLVEGFQPLIIHMVKRVVQRAKSMEFLDLVQEANIGLLQAIDDDDPSKGLPLRALAIRCINHALYHALAFRDPHVALSFRTTVKLGKLHKAERRLTARLQRPPSLAEVAAEIGTSEEDLTQALSYEQWEKVESLHKLLFEDEAEDEYGFVSLFAQATQAEQAREASLQQALQEAIQTTLTPRQREVILLRYQSEDKRACSKKAVARQLHLYPATVAKREQAALEQLRKSVPRLAGWGDDEEGEVA